MSRGRPTFTESNRTIVLISSQERPKSKHFSVGADNPAFDRASDRERETEARPLHRHERLEQLVAVSKPAFSGRSGRRRYLDFISQRRMSGKDRTSPFQGEGGKIWSVRLARCPASRTGSPVGSPNGRAALEAGTGLRARGCAKTPAFILRVKRPSRFRQSENQKCCGSSREKAIKKNDSPHSWLAHVCTQPGPILAIRGTSRDRLSWVQTCHSLSRLWLAQGVPDGR